MAARQVHIGTRLGGRGRHLVDVLATDAAGRRVLVSLKWMCQNWAYEDS